MGSSDRDLFVQPQCSRSVGEYGLILKDVTSIVFANS